MAPNKLFALHEVCFANIDKCAYICALKSCIASLINTFARKERISEINDEKRAN